jgi:hypothetical protein
LKSDKVMVAALGKLEDWEMERMKLTDSKRQHILTGLASADAPTVAKARKQAWTFLVQQEEAQETINQIGASETAISKLKSNPPRLVPVGLAEAWVGNPKGGFPNKQNGEIIDSCYTCHNTIGDALCGVKEMQELQRKNFPEG